MLAVYRAQTTDVFHGSFILRQHHKHKFKKISQKLEAIQLRGAHEACTLAVHISGRVAPSVWFSISGANSRLVTGRLGNDQLVTLGSCGSAATTSVKLDHCILGNDSRLVLACSENLMNFYSLFAREEFFKKLN